MSKKIKIIAIDDSPDHFSDGKICKFITDTLEGKIDLYKISSQENKTLGLFDKFIHKEIVKAKTRTISSTLNPRGLNIVVYGHGGYHHETYGLVHHTKAIKDKPGKTGYIHFDHHHDWGHKEQKTLDCGSFVRTMEEDLDLQPLLIGQEIPSFWHPLSGKYERDATSSGDFLLDNQFNEFTINEKLDALPSDVYLSFDLDMLDYSEISTGYGQGTTKLPTLVDLISKIQTKKNIIGADILGFTPRRGTVGRSKSLLCYSAIIGQLAGRDITEILNLHQKTTGITEKKAISITKEAF